MTTHHLPECPRGQPTLCRLTPRPEARTMKYDPVTLDDTGAPVAGGSNTIFRTLRCDTCGHVWKSGQSELDAAKGLPPDWLSTT